MMFISSDRKSFHTLDAHEQKLYRPQSS